MSFVRSFGLCASLVLVPSLASADESIVSTVKARIETQLVKPLTEKENQRSSFSRVRMAPRERRVRVTQDAPTLDGKDNGYVTFAVDVRFFGGEWSENDVVGCAYLKSGQLFVKRGDEFRPASILLGQAGDAVPGVCRPKAPAKA